MRQLKLLGTHEEVEFEMLLRRIGYRLQVGEERYCRDFSRHIKSQVRKSVSWSTKIHLTFSWGKRDAVSLKESAPDSR